MPASAPSAASKKLGIGKRCAASPRARPAPSARCGPKSRRPGRGAARASPPRSVLRSRCRAAPVGPARCRHSRRAAGADSRRGRWRLAGAREQRLADGRAHRPAVQQQLGPPLRLVQQRAAAGARHAQRRTGQPQRALLVRAARRRRAPRSARRGARAPRARPPRGARQPAHPASACGAASACSRKESTAGRPTASAGVVGVVVVVVALCAEGEGGGDAVGEAEPTRRGSRAVRTVWTVRTVRADVRRALGVRPLEHAERRRRTAQAARVGLALRLVERRVGRRGPRAERVGACATSPAATHLDGVAAQGGGELWDHRRCPRLSLRAAPKPNASNDSFVSMTGITVSTSCGRSGDST